MNFKNILADIDINDEYIIVGVSSGSDSMALFHYLINNSNKKIVCAHINHNVRKESEQEQIYLKKYCMDKNIIFETIKLTNYSENNFENEARKRRYQFYEELLNKYHTKYLFLAHHGDDLIETILMKIVRGSNIEGYAGFKKINPIKNYYIIRPLIQYTKNDIIKYCNYHNITYFDDITNTNSTYTRNRYRKNILPLLKKEDNDVHLKFLKFSETLLEYQNYIEKVAIEYTKKIYIKNILNLTEFKKTDVFIQKNILYYILNNSYNNISNIIKEKHINNILYIINSSKPNLQINLPSNKIAIKSYQNLEIKDNIKNKELEKIPLKNYINFNNSIIKIVESEEGDGNNICRLNSKDIKLPIFIREKKQGDYIILKGINKRKKVSDIFIDCKIPKKNRESYPIIIDSNDNILWIPNLKKSKFNIKKNEKHDIIIKYCEKEEI